MQNPQLYVCTSCQSVFVGSPEVLHQRQICCGDHRYRTEQQLKKEIERPLSPYTEENKEALEVLLQAKNAKPSIKSMGKF